MPNTREKLYRLGVIDAPDADGRPFEFTSPVGSVNATSLSANIEIQSKTPIDMTSEDGYAIVFKELSGGGLVEYGIRFGVDPFGDGLTIKDEREARFFDVNGDLAIIDGGYAVNIQVGALRVDGGIESVGDLAIIEFEDDGSVTLYPDEIEDFGVGTYLTAQGSTVYGSNGRVIQAYDFTDPFSPTATSPVYGGPDTIVGLTVSGDTLFARTEYGWSRFDVSSPTPEYVGPIKPQYVENYEEGTFGIATNGTDAIFADDQSQVFKLFSDAPGPTTI